MDAVNVRTNRELMENMRKDGWNIDVSTLYTMFTNTVIFIIMFFFEKYHRFVRMSVYMFAINFVKP